MYVNSWTLLFVTAPCFRHPGLPIIKKEQGYCRNSEIAVLRGAVGQYNVIHTLPYDSVPPMYKSAYVVECPQTSLNMCVIVDGFQFYWKISKLVQGERFRRNDWISCQLFSQKLPQFCVNAWFGNGLYPQHWGLSHSLASSLSSSFSSTGRGTLLAGVASPSTIEALFISLRGKKGGRN